MNIVIEEIRTSEEADKTVMEIDEAVQETIPFLVTDRPASLQIIRGINIPRDKKIGLMTHANTSANFKKIFAQFPCSERDYCEVLRKKCSYGRTPILYRKSLPAAESH